MDEADVYWDSFMVLIFEKMTRNMKKDVNAEVSRYGLTSAQVPYIIALKINDGQTMTSLSNFLDMDEANTSRIIRSLEKMGVVSQPKPHVSSRRYPVFLTEYGAEIGEHLMRYMAGSIDRYFEGVSSADYIRVRNNLIRLFRNIIDCRAFECENVEQTIPGAVTDSFENSIL